MCKIDKFCTVGGKSQKTPINQVVRTDPRDPSGRLHAYWSNGPLSQHQKKSDLASVRYINCSL